ncbi:sugar transferase, partial [Staphylococcus piscifermentans]
MYKNTLKRTFDLVISILVMPFFIIISLMVGLLIKREDKGPIFYTSKRLGKDKK